MGQFGFSIKRFHRFFLPPSSPSGEVGADIYKKLIADPKMSDWGGAAMNSLRLEKGIPLFGKDFTKDHSALEVGIHPKFVKLDKVTDFTGKQALKQELADAESGKIKLRKLVLLEVDVTAEGRDMGKSFSSTGTARAADTDFADCSGNEPIFDESSGKCVGFTTSGAPGFCTGKSVAMGYVPSEISKEGAASLSVELLGVRYPIYVRDKPAMLSWGPRQKALREAAAGGSGGTVQGSAAAMHAAPAK